MTLGRLILVGLLGLVVAEAAVFLLAAQVLGSFMALLALLAGSAAGVVVLARMGRRLAERLADMLSRRDAAGIGSGSALTVLAGLLLLLPGFLSDIAALLLLLPPVQRRLLRKKRARRDRRGGGQVLDLDPSQWRDLPDKHIPDDRESGR